MLYNFKKVITLSFILFSLATSAHAEDTPTSNYYIPLAPLPHTTNGNCDPGSTDSGTGCTTDLQTYLPGIIKWAIDVSAVLAFIMITVGGIWLATSDSLTGKTESKAIISNAIWGLVLVIGAYVILHTINPDILNINLKWDKPEIKGAVTQGVITSASCPNTCVSAQQALGTEHSHVSGFIDSTLVSKILPLSGSNFMPDLQKANISWYVSEATGDNSGYAHTDPCHANGTCVDVNITNPTPDNIKVFFAAAKDGTNINASYEVKTQAALDTLRAAGIPISPNCSGNGTACINTGASGPHFHIK